MGKKQYKISVILCVILVSLVLAINVVQVVAISSFSKKSTVESYAMDCTQITNAYSLAIANKISEYMNQMYATVLQDANAQAATALELVWQCMKKGSAIGYMTKAGLRAASQVTKEAPLTESSVISQCFVVPFVPVQK